MGAEKKKTSLARVFSRVQPEQRQGGRNTEEH